MLFYNINLPCYTFVFVSMVIFTIACSRNFCFIFKIVLYDESIVKKKVSKELVSPTHCNIKGTLWKKKWKKYLFYHSTKNSQDEIFLASLYWFWNSIYTFAFHRDLSNLHCLFFLINEFGNKMIDRGCILFNQKCDYIVYIYVFYKLPKSTCSRQNVSDISECENNIYYSVALQY